MESERIATTAVMARDAGKTQAEADPEVSEAIDFARFYSSSIPDLTGSTPVGTVVVVPPWNFPYAIPAGGVFAALAAGNAVILKPAPETVATAWQLVRQLWAGGVPKNVLQFVPTRDDDAGRHLVTHDDVDAVILTGSFDTAVMFSRWRPTINLLAETSGKNSILDQRMRRHRNGRARRRPVGIRSRRPKVQCRQPRNRRARRLRRPCVLAPTGRCRANASCRSGLGTFHVGRANHPTRRSRHLERALQSTRTRRELARSTPTCSTMRACCGRRA